MITVSDAAKILRPADSPGGCAPADCSGRVTHTPGPWSIGHRENLVVAGNYMPGRMHGSIASCIFTTSGAPYKRTPTPAEAIANARLIAAAPDLLAACKALRTAIMLHDTAIDECALHGADDSVMSDSRDRLTEAEDQALAAIEKATTGQNAEMSGSRGEKPSTNTQSQ